MGNEPVSRQAYADTYGRGELFSSAQFMIDGEPFSVEVRYLFDGNRPNAKNTKIYLIREGVPTESKESLRKRVTDLNNDLEKCARIRSKLEKALKKKGKRIE